MSNCLLCSGVGADSDLMRVQVWEDRHWRLTTALVGEAPGFSYLEPKRHIRYIHDLRGVEAQTFGPVLSECSRVIKEVTSADLVYVYIFGGSFDHLHVHLAPQAAGGPFNDCMIKGDVVEIRLPNGAIMHTSKEFAMRPEADMHAAADLIRAAFASEEGL